MDIAIGTTFNFDIPIETMVPMVAGAGFRRISLAGGNARASGYLNTDIRARTIKVCTEHDVVVDSIHAPFGRQLDISSPDLHIRSAGVDLTIQSIDACAAFGGVQLMIHLNDRFEEPELETRLGLVEKSMAVIVEHARSKGVDLSVENLPSPQADTLFRHVLSRYMDPHVGVCLDTSHAHLSGTLYDIMDSFGARMNAVHISDNRGEHDDHLLPFEGVIDWERFARYFSRIRYRGTFLLEVEMRESAFKDPEEFLRQARLRSTKLMQMIRTYQDPA